MLTFNIPQKTVEYFVLYMCYDIIELQCGRDEDQYRSRGPRQWWIVLPWQTTAFHVIGQGHVVAPHVKLPFPQTEYSAQHVPCVNSYPHVDVKASGLADKPTCDEIQFESTLLLLSGHLSLLHFRCTHLT